MEFREDPPDDEFPPTFEDGIGHLRNSDGEDFSKLFGDFVRDYQRGLEAYLQRRGISQLDSQETVQDFLTKQCRVRTIFRGPCGNGSFRRFLKTCVLRHFIDLYRKSTRREDQVAKLAKDDTKLVSTDPMEVAWALAVLQVAIVDFRQSLDPVSAGEIRNEDVKPKVAGDDAAYSERELDWKIFLLKYLATSAFDTMHDQKITSARIGERLGLSEQRVRNRLKKIRNMFQLRLQRAIRDTTPSDDYAQATRDFVAILLANGTQIPDAAEFLPELIEEPLLDLEPDYSMGSLDSVNSTDMAELLEDFDSTNEHVKQLDIWERFMGLTMNQYDTLNFPKTHPKAKLQLEAFLFDPNLSISELKCIRQTAGSRGRSSKTILRATYHLLYTLVIALGKNLFGQRITSMSILSAVKSMQQSLQYDWSPDKVSREIELAVRTFTEDDSTRESRQTP